MRTFRRHEQMPAGTKSYQKKPLVVQAIQMDEDFMVKTPEGTMYGKAGDYLIQGIEGEKYPCQKVIFEKSYEKKTD